MLFQENLQALSLTLGSSINIIHYQLMNYILFFLFSFISIGSIIAIIFINNTLYNALLLVLSFLGIAGFYALLSSPFLSVIQIIIYAGAIMILFIFAIMLIDIRKKEEIKLRFTNKLSIILAISFFILLSIPVASLIFPRPEIEGNQYGNVDLIGEFLFKDFLYPFEITSILIIVALIGGIILSKKKI
ncbi:MAG: NADH-quinone oxidoreductase subunit J [Acidobacteriota bacterium]